MGEVLKNKNNKEKKDNKKNNKIDYKALLKKIVDFVKKYYIIFIAVLVVVVLCLILVLRTKKSDKFALDEIYSIFPEEVRALYANMVKIGCDGDLKFDVKLDSDELDLENMNHDDLLKYIFSYMDKNELLSDSFDTSQITKASNELLSDKVNLIKDIKTFDYGDYTYNLDGKTVTRKKRTCTSAAMTHVSHLFGYFWKDGVLSVDINVAYLKDGALYEYNTNKKLGEYDGELSSLSELTNETSYYRVNFVKDKGKYKLSSIEWKNRE